jgi:hypothetical protein
MNWRERVARPRNLRYGRATSCRNCQNPRFVSFGSTACWRFPKIRINGRSSSTTRQQQAKSAALLGKMSPGLLGRLSPAG